MSVEDNVKSNNIKMFIRTIVHIWCLELFENAIILETKMVDTKAK